jgi:hypothetical protein
LHPRLVRSGRRYQGCATALKANGPAWVQTPKREARNQKRRARGDVGPPASVARPSLPFFRASTGCARDRHAPRSPLLIRETRARKTMTRTGRENDGARPQEPSPVWERVRVTARPCRIRRVRRRCALPRAILERPALTPAPLPHGRGGASSIRRKCHEPRHGPRGHRRRGRDRRGGVRRMVGAMPDATRRR